MVARIIITREISEPAEANEFIAEVENALYSVDCSIGDTEIIDDEGFEVDPDEFDED